MSGSLCADHAKDILSNGKKPANHGFEMWSGPFATYDNNVWLFFGQQIQYTLLAHRNGYREGEESPCL